jgi:D-inositol-3-phosphate glycosyltransferase
MKIAFISYWSCPLTKLGVLNSGGMSVYIMNLAYQLSKLSHSIDIFTRTHNRKDISELVKKGNINIIHFKQDDENLYKDLDNFTRKILKYSQENSKEYDLFHSHYFYSGLIGLKLKKILKKPQVFTFHSLGKYEINDKSSFDQKRIESEKYISSNIDGLIVNTPLEESIILNKHKASKSKIFITSPGVDHDIFFKKDKIQSRKQIRISTRQKMILFVGRIDPNKGVNILLDAVYHLTKLNPEFEKNYKVLLIGGDITNRDFWRQDEVIRIKNNIISKKLSCCVKFIGSKPHDELAKYYSAADLVVLPSLHETFGLVMLEAMACGASIIASRVGGLKYLVKDRYNGRFFESNDYLDLAKIIWELLNDNEQRLRLSQNAIKFAKGYSWKNQAKEIEKFYSNF